MARNSLVDGQLSPQNRPANDSTSQRPTYARFPGGPCESPLLHGDASLALLVLFRKLE